MFEELKMEVVRVAKDADRSGMCRHKSGNFSIRDAETGLVVVSPSGVAREILKPEDCIVVDMDGNVVENLMGRKPTSETPMHLAAYQVRPDRNAIVHTHARYSTAFAILNRELPAIAAESMHLGKSRTVPVAPYGKVGSKELAENVAETLKETDCCLMRSHGSIAMGNTLDDAYLKAQYVEEIAQLYYIVLTANGGQEPDHIE